MSGERETGAVAADSVDGPDPLMRSLILETAGVELLLGSSRRRSSRRRRALFQYTVLLAGRTEL